MMVTLGMCILAYMPVKEGREQRILCSWIYGHEEPDMVAEMGILGQLSEQQILFTLTQIFQPPKIK